MPGRNGKEANRIDEQFDFLGDMTYNVSTQQTKVGAYMAFDQTKYVTDFIKENYDRVEIKVPKGKRAILKKLAQDFNFVDDKGKISVSRMIIECLEEKYGVDLSKPD